jgi:hypothetical protein
MVYDRLERLRFEAQAVRPEPCSLLSEVLDGANGFAIQEL